MPPRRTLDVRVDGATVTVEETATILEACDAAGRYVPRLCYYPGLGCCAGGAAESRPAGARECGTCDTGAHEAGARECGLCVVRVAPASEAAGGGSADDAGGESAAAWETGAVVLACATPAKAGLAVSTDAGELRALRLERLGAILAGHPHVCLSCPDRDGCTREACTYGNPPEARCCDLSGRCELGKLVQWLDPRVELPRRAVRVAREATSEGRIRREPGLCIRCGRCVRVCGSASEAGRALEMPGDGSAARPTCGTLVDSGCTFCGLCVMVCPTGAVTAPGEAGARWLAGRREKTALKAGVLPPESRQSFSREHIAAVSAAAGVFRLLDSSGDVVLIRGVSDLRDGLLAALDDPTCGAAAFFQVELHPLYTQRESELLAQHVKEHGGLPPANDLGDDLFDD